MRRVRACAFSMIIGTQDDHWHYLVNFVMLKCVQLINAPSGGSRFRSDDLDRPPAGRFTMPSSSPSLQARSPMARGW
jgi:hypothetical protein